MGRRWLVSVVAVALVALVGAVPAAAGGWATVRLEAPPAEVWVGEPVRIGFMILQHDIRPVEDGEPFLTARHRATGESLRAEGVAEGEPGHYVAEVTFPIAGTWTWEIAPAPFPGSTSFPPLEVLESAEAAAVAKPEAVHLAHVFAGTCAKVDPTPLYPLANVELPAATGGAQPLAAPASGVAVKRGETNIEVSLEQLLAKPHAITVQAGAADLKRSIACGDIAGAPGDHGLLVGLVEQDGSGYAGIAELRPDGARTAATVFLARGLAGGAQPKPEVTGSGATAAVDIAGAAFGPELLEVTAGTTVTWTNRDSVAHEVNFDDPSLDDSGLLDPGGAYALTLTAPGTYTYHCGPHTGMTGTIIVQ